MATFNKISSEDSVLRNFVKRSSVEGANRTYQSGAYPNLTHEPKANDLCESHLPAKSYPFLVPSAVKNMLGGPTALAIGAFATTLMSLSFRLMEWRGVAFTNVYIDNFFFVT